MLVGFGKYKTKQQNYSELSFVYNGHKGL